MKMHWAEVLAMNNPVRRCIQRWIEAERLRKLGGVLDGGKVLEIGCGSGFGVKLILSVFKAGHVDAFDLDERMVRLAKRRTRASGDRVSLWTGDVCSIPQQDNHYDAVFDFGMVHHVPDWRSALTEVHRVLKPGGRFFAEEAYDAFVYNAPWRWFLRQPYEGWFDSGTFGSALRDSGFEIVGEASLGNWFGWFVADRKMPNNKGCSGVEERDLRLHP